MTRVSREALRDCLDGLDPTELTAFVEAVYDARGWETARIDGDLRVTPPGADESRLIAIRRDAGDEEGDTDAGEHGSADDEAVDADAVDTADLRQMVRYAVDTETRARLFRRFFDCEPSDLAEGRAHDDSKPVAASGAGSNAGAGSDDTGGSSTGTTRADVSPPATGRRTGDPTHRRPATDGRQTGDPTHRRPTTDDRQTGATTRPPADAPRHERTTGRGSTDGASAGRAKETTADASIPTARWVAVGLAAVIVVGGVVATVGPGPASPGVDGDAGGAAIESNGTATDDGPDVMDREGLPIAPGVRRVEAADGSLPPGVDPTGVTDASALADAHEAALSDRSYRLRITHREFVDGELRGVTHERAVVESSGRYRSQVRTLGAIRHESGVIAPASTYANGTAEYVRPSESDTARERIEIRSRTGMDDIVDRTERAVRWYLSVNDSRIAGRDDEATTIRIAIRGDPWPESRNVTGWARVDEDGLVRELYREYTPTSAPNVRVEVTIRIVPGPVTVTRPEWVETTNESYDRPAPARATPTDSIDGGRA